MGHAVLILLAGFLLHIGCGARRVSVVHSPSTLLVRIYGTQTACPGHGFNLDDLLNELIQVRISNHAGLFHSFFFKIADVTNGMTIGLSYDCLSYYYKIVSSDHNPPEDFVLVQFLTGQEELRQNTTDLFYAMFDKIDNYLDLPYQTM